MTIDGDAMGTTWTVQVDIRGEEQETQLLNDAIAGLLESTEQQMSTWRSDSEISKFNSGLSTNWIPIGPRIATVLRQAQAVSRATSGAFDVTVLPLVELWGFTSQELVTNAPPAKALTIIRQATGFQKLQVSNERDEVRKLHHRTQVDLSALAKGYAVDLVCGLLGEMKYTNYLVEIGGELRGHGDSKKGRPWRVGLELPIVGKSELGDAVDLPNNALATSGDYRNFLELDGQRYAHIINPRTGHPIKQQGIAVSVLAPTCMEADAWATALTVLGIDQGLQLAEQEKLAVQFRVYLEGELVQQSSAQWPKNP
ncbi:MAG: FAD:protein FMN transferase [Limisphaerales bacterium]